MKSVICFFMALCFGNIVAQSTDNLWKGERGRIIIPTNSDIKGDDFLYDEWNNGILVLFDSVFSEQKYLKYDAYLDRILIKNMNNLDEIIEITDNSITGFALIEKKNNVKHNFVRLKKEHFTDESVEGFYEVVFNFERTNYFLKKNTIAVFDPNRSEGSQTINNLPSEYKNKITYYIKNDGDLYVKTRLSKKKIKEILSDHTKLVDTFIKSNKISFSDEGDVMKLINYYYSL